MNVSKEFVIEITHTIGNLTRQRNALIKETQITIRFLRKQREKIYEETRREECVLDFDNRIKHLKTVLNTITKT